jgi:predicted NBD/HSP70 family sugar kinase
MPVAPDPWIGPRGSSTERVLQILRAHGPMTRPEAARLTGMSVGGIRPIVASLLERGDVVVDADAGRGGRGRPGAVLRAVGPDGLAVALDFGHSHVAVAVGDADGTVLAFDRRTADVDRDAASALRIAATLTRSALRAAGVVRGDVRRVVVGVPGPVDRTGALRSSTIAVDWSALSIAPAVADRLHVETSLVDVENDAHLGALGEVRAGSARGCSEVVYVKASHGLGAGLVLGGELYRGASGLTGEIGHAVVDPDGALCRCGSRGCLETVVSVERVRDQVRYVLSDHRAEGDPLTVAGTHPAARRIVLDAGRALGRALADVCNVLNPQRIVLGGELAAAGQPLVDGVTESIARYAQPAVADTPVRLSELGERAQAVGALALGAERARAASWSAAR